MRPILCRSSRPKVFCKKGVFENFAKFTRKHLRRSLLFNNVAGLFYWKKTPKQVFSCEFCKISKNNFLYRTPAMAASAYGKPFNWFSLQMHLFLHDGGFGFKWFKGLWKEALAIEKNKISVKNYWNLLGKLLWLKLGF